MTISPNNPNKFYLWCAAVLTMVLVSLAMAASSQINPMEYPPNHPNFANEPTVINQLQNFPTPRYKNNHTLLPNYNWIDDLFAGDYKQPGITDQVACERMAAIQVELAKNFNYMVSLKWGNGLANQYAVAVANANPSFKTSITTLRAQTHGCSGSSCLWCGCLAADHYLQDSQGRYLGWGGEVISYKGTWRPTSNPQDWVQDGINAKGLVQSSLNSLNRNVDFVNEDGEVYPMISNYGLNQDPVVKAAMGTMNPQLYLAREMAENDNAYRDQIMSLPKCSGAKYSEYRLDGHRTFQFMWEEARKVNTKINNQYYSTADMYVRWANNWQNWVSAWHGRKWITQSRHYEIAAGDKLFSPFVAAGWDANPEVDVRPAQWLGLLKQLGVMGAEFYYPSYFNDAANYNPPNPPPNNPKGYAWQYVMPSYSQAITSHYEDVLRNGDLMAGDITDNTNTDEIGTPKPIPLYQFYTGKNNYVVAGRKLGTKYVITGTIQNSSNQIGSAPLEDVCTITLEGQQLTFKIRRQGSTYIYDSGAKIFFQLDGWHESSHPWYWQKDIELEAEVFDNSTGTIRSYYATPDLTNFKTVIVLSTNQNSNYSFINRTTLNTLFIKASGTGTLETTLDGTIRTITVNGEGWNKVDLGSLQAGDHTLWLTALSNLEIDSISVTSNPNKYPVNVPVVCRQPENVYINGVQDTSCIMHWTLSNPGQSATMIYVKNNITGKEKRYKKGSAAPKPERKFISELTPQTSYSVRFRSLCGATDTSEYTSPVPFTTK